MKQALLAVLVATLVCACTTVRIQGADGETRIERGFGIMSLRLEPDSDPMLAEVTTLGVGHSPFGTTLGYSSQSLAVVPPDCHVVLWVERAEQLEHVRSMLSEVANVCPMLMKEERR